MRHLTMLYSSPPEHKLQEVLAASPLHVFTMLHYFMLRCTILQDRRAVPDPLPGSQHETKARCFLAKRSSSTSPPAPRAVFV